MEQSGAKGLAVRTRRGGPVSPEVLTWRHRRSRGKHQMPASLSSAGPFLHAGWVFGVTMEAGRGLAGHERAAHGVVVWFAGCAEGSATADSLRRRASTSARAGVDLAAVSPIPSLVIGLPRILRQQSTCGTNSSAPGGAAGSALRPTEGLWTGLLSDLPISSISSRESRKRVSRAEIFHSDFSHNQKLKYSLRYLTVQ